MGETAVPETITVDETELAGYADEHTKAPKHRSWSLPSPAVDVLPAGQVAPPVVARRAAPVVAVPCRFSREVSASATRCSGSA